MLTTPEPIPAFPQDSLDLLDRVGDHRVVGPDRADLADLEPAEPDGDRQVSRGVGPAHRHGSADPGPATGHEVPTVGIAQPHRGGAPTHPVGEARHGVERRIGHRIEHTQRVQLGADAPGLDVAEVRFARVHAPPFPAGRTNAPEHTTGPRAARPIPENAQQTVTTTAGRAIGSHEGEPTDPPVTR